jgi:hypothetical protein
MKKLLLRRTVWHMRSSLGLPARHCQGRREPP